MKGLHQPAFLIKVRQFLGSALAILLLLVVYWEKADEAGEGIGLLLASFPNLVIHYD